MKPKFALRHFILLASSVCFATSSLQAADGTWNVNAGGNWNDTETGNWLGGIVADGSGFTANFTMTTGGANRTINVDGVRTIGNITRNWAFNNQLTISGSAITLAGTTPTITNNDLGTNRRMIISSQILGSDGLNIAGGGIVLLTNNNNSYTGSTTITGNSFLDFGGITNANLGGGTGRNVTVEAGSAVRFNALSNTFLNRIAQTNDEIVVMTGSTSNALDFSSTGADLPNAFLSNWASIGAKTEISGIITPGAGAYRLGSLFQSGALGITQTSLLSGDNQLIIGGNRVVIVGAHTFTGDTTIRDGGRLGLAAFTGGFNSLALQNSALDLGATTATGQIFLEAATTAGPITGANDTGTSAAGTTSATFGGLKGSRNLVSAFVVGNTGNNTSGTALADITGFTLNVGTGNTHTYSGSIGGFGAGAASNAGGNSTLTKTGLGTQVFEGDHTYTGATSINEGTLILNGSTAAGSAVSVASGATLGGVGTVNGTLDVTGIIAPGNNDISTLTVNNNVTWNGASSAGSVTDWRFELGSGDTADLLFIDGDFTKNTASGSNFRFDFLGSTALGTFELISWTGTTDFVESDFSQFNYAGAFAGSFSISDNSLFFTAIPEPSTALAGILLGLGLLRRRRGA